MTFYKSFSSPFTRTSDTETHYRSKGMDILRRYCSECGVEVPDPVCFNALNNNDDFMSWMRKYRGNVSPSTWRSIRSSVSFCIEFGMWHEQYPWMKESSVFETSEEGVYENFAGDKISLNPNEKYFAEHTPSLPVPGGIVRLASKEMKYFAQSVRDIDTSKCTAPTKTSANKKKSINDKELRALVTELKTGRKTITKRHTLNLLLANMIVGLRPSEWLNTELYLDDEKITKGFLEKHVPQFALPHLASGDLVVADIDSFTLPLSLSEPKIKLIVLNGKNTNGRSHGKVRTLSLNSNLHHTYRKAIFYQWLTAQLIKEGGYLDFDGDNPSDIFEAYYESCRKSLYRMTKKLWPSAKQRVSFYSSRHQAIADAKNVKPLNEIAALFGHGNDRTATEHYGKKRSGNGKRFAMDAEPEEVSRIKILANKMPTVSKSKSKSVSPKLNR
jgi:hypothetical protein